MSEEIEIDKLQKLIDRCNECDLAECINFEISWTEVQALKSLFSQYKNLKEIEEEHRKLNGELRVELEKEKEKNKNVIKFIKDNNLTYSCNFYDDGVNELFKDILKLLEE